MISHRQLFLQHLAQTSDSPLLLEVEKASGIYMYSPEGKEYIDLISGISVSNVGHCHPKVVDAAKKQLDKYMHLMVYGEYVQSPQVNFAKLLTDQLPDSLNSVYLVNSGSEAIEGALKLAKRYTGRSEIISFHNAYHGSTHGALSIMGDEVLKKPFRPLLPDVRFIELNKIEDLQTITENTACVVVETIQGEAGIMIPDGTYLHELRKKCNQTGTLLIFDEIQTGFGRTGKLFAFQKFNVIPDIFTVAKGVGGGMPLGAFVSSNEIMGSLKVNPILGHITTFGGHPVSCAAALASLQLILEEKLIDSVLEKGELFKSLLRHKLIKSIRGTGLLMAVELEDFETVQKLIGVAKDNGLITDWFLFCDNSFRIAPPLIITVKEIEKSCAIILKSLDIISKG